PANAGHPSRDTPLLDLQSWKEKRREGDRAQPVKEGKLRAHLAAVAAKPKEALARLRRDFFASTSLKPKASRKRLVLKVASEVATSLRGGGDPMPLCTKVLEATAAVFKEAGYKSAEAYLVELKLIHVEAGHPWTHALQRCLDLCKKSVRRNRGPRKKALALNLDKAAATKVSKNWVRRKGRLAHPKESFLFAGVWMLREDELERVETSDVRIEDKLVYIYLAHSQTDIEAQGGSAPRGQEDEGSQEIRSPLLHQVRLRLGTGRWKSDVVLEYAAEALEERPALEGEKKGGKKRKACGVDADFSSVLMDHTSLFKEMKEANEEFKSKLQDNLANYLDIVEKSKANSTGSSTAQ
ncbi:ANKRD50, partial [Symbiodinium necroappetens]